MVKQRMSSADVAAEVVCLKAKLLGMRMANVYDLTPKTYVLKLARSTGGESEKTLLLLESGSRFHTTQIMRDKSDVPNNFTMKLRKHIRTKRLEDVRQLGVDRIVDFVFGSGEAQYHLILEMYAQGNIVLCDHKYEVLTLLRSHRDDARGFAVMARHPYPMDAVRLRQAARREELHDAYCAAEPSASLKSVLAGVIPYGPAIAEHCLLDAGLQPNAKVGGAAVGAAAAIAPPAPPAVDPDADGLDEDGQKAAAVVAAPAPAAAAPVVAVVRSAGLPEEQLSALHAALTRLEDWFTGLDAAPPGGFITLEPIKATPPPTSGAAAPGGAKGKKLTKKQQQLAAQQQQLLAAEGGLPPAAAATEAAPAAAAAAPSGSAAADGGSGGPSDAAVGAAATGTSEDAAAAADGKGVVYQDFNPLLLHQTKGTRTLEFPSFDVALDEFYSKIEGQRAELAQAEAEAQALHKLGRIREDNDARAGALGHEADEEDAKAQLIEVNLDVVDGAINAVNAALATGMDWRDLERMIKEERKAGNPVAACIASLQLEANSATLLLVNMLEGEDEGDEVANTRRATRVVVDLGVNAYGNARAHFDSRKRHSAKQVKTLAANEQALKAAEKKAQAQLLKVRSTPSALAPARKLQWFERFHWFVSSENYMVISGRDAQQNELIVKRYFRKGDAYVHAELHGASSTIVKNPYPERPVPPMTLQQAGCACVCRSRAWDSKIITSAWWVQHHQVSKAAPTGEYLPTGSFMIRGKKSFLPPQPLIFGFGFMFKLEESSIAGHLGERAVRGADGSESLTTAASLASWPEPEEEAAEDDVEVPEGSSSDEEGAEDKAPAGSSAAGAGDATTTSRQASSAGASSSAANALQQFMESSADVGNYSRYGLQAPTAADHEVPADDAAGGSGGGGGAADEGGSNGAGAAFARGPSGKRHLSAKEREALKKGMPLPPPGPPRQKGGGGAVPSGRPSPGQGSAAQDAEDGAEEAEDGADDARRQGGSGGGGRGAGRTGAAGGRGGPPAAGRGSAANGKPGAGSATARPPAGGQHAAGGGAGGGKQGKGKQAAAAEAAAEAAEAAEAQPSGQGGPQRGKNLQAKKLRGKYADQDEEDRKFALEVLGSQGEKKTKTDRRKDRKVKREGKRQAGMMTHPTALDSDAMQEALSRAMRKDFVKAPTVAEGAAEGEDEDGDGASDSGTDEGSHSDASSSGRAVDKFTADVAAAAAELASCAIAQPAAAAAPGGELRGTDDDVHVTAPTTLVDDNDAPQSGGGGPKGPNPARAARRAEAAAAGAAERAEISALMAEENVMELGDDERERLSVLDTLTGCPRPDDILMFALPVCGPYQIMQNWKFKVKLTPGSVKKGKAARQITELLSRSSDVLQRERELLKACPDNDSATAMVGTVKISMPGLQKLKASEKQGRRTAARAAMALAPGAGGISPGAAAFAAKVLAGGGKPAPA